MVLTKSEKLRIRLKGYFVSHDNSSFSQLSLRIIEAFLTLVHILVLCCKQTHRFIFKFRQCWSKIRDSKSLTSLCRDLPVEKTSPLTISQHYKALDLLPALQSVQPYIQGSHKLSSGCVHRTQGEEKFAVQTWGGRAESLPPSTLECQTDWSSWSDISFMAADQFLLSARADIRRQNDRSQSRRIRLRFGFRLLRFRRLHMD